MAFRAACSAVTCAANGVLLREPLKPLAPELDQDNTLPAGSVRVTIVLLNVAWIYARPRGTFFRSRRRTRVLPFVWVAPRRRSDIRGIPLCPIQAFDPDQSRRLHPDYFFFLRPIARFGPRRVRAFVRVC